MKAQPTLIRPEWCSLGAPNQEQLGSRTKVGNGFSEQPNALPSNGFHVRITLVVTGPLKDICFPDTIPKISF